MKHFLNAYKIAKYIRGRIPLVSVVITLKVNETLFDSGLTGKISIYFSHE